MKKKLLNLLLLSRHFVFIDALVLSVGLVLRHEKINLPIGKRALHIRKGTMDLETFKEIYLSCLYGVNLPFNPETIVDAGANIGFASLFFHMKYPDAEIVALEIEGKNIDCIKKNTKGLKNFELIKKALFNRKAFFKLEDRYHTTNSFQITEVSSTSKYDIESTTLDEILSNKKWKTIDVLKIDIEGSEKELFESNYKSWLAKTKVIMIETHDRIIPNCSYAVSKALNECNFILQTTTEGTLIYFNKELIGI